MPHPMIGAIVYLAGLQACTDHRVNCWVHECSDIFYAIPTEGCVEWVHCLLWLNYI